jgi:hypothetical protein
MADEQTKPPFNRPSIIPKDPHWASLLRLESGMTSKWSFQETPRKTASRRYCVFSNM